MTELQTVARQELTQELTPSLFNEYIQLLDASPRTRESYGKAVKQFASYLFYAGETRPTRENLLQWKHELQLTAHRPTTVANYLEAVRLFFKWTEQEGRYPNIANGIKLPKLDRQHHNKDCLTTEQVKRLLSNIDRTTLKGKRDYAIVCLQCVCALRDVEISRANIEDLRSWGDNAVLYVMGKGHQEKDTPVILPVEIDRAIREYLTARGKYETGTPLFVSTSNNKSKDGGRLTTRSISGIAKEHLISAGFNSERLTAHSLRHTSITLALINGESLEAVQHFARHSNVQTTLIYSHAVDEQKSTVSRTVADSVFT